MTDKYESLLEKKKELTKRLRELDEEYELGLGVPRAGEVVLAMIDIKNELSSLEKELKQAQRIRE